MKKLRAWFATPAGRQFFNIVYSLGASIVIIGAMCKIIHIKGADYIFITGMIVEAIIFFLSAFDTSYTENSPVTGTNSVIITANNNQATSSHSEPVPTVKRSSATINSTSSVTTVGGSNDSGVSGDRGNIAACASNISDYAEGAVNAAQNLDEFSKTLKSLNETSQTLLKAYKEIADTQNIGETLNSVRYINDSLARIKNYYDGAIGDSYMFKEEMAKMTRHIEALNNVYARLLQAMTNTPTNNPPASY